jgi:hypothetical protein
MTAYKLNAAPTCKLLAGGDTRVELAPLAPGLKRPLSGVLIKVTALVYAYRLGWCIRVVVFDKMNNF